MRARLLQPKKRQGSRPGAGQEDDPYPTPHGSPMELPAIALSSDPATSLREAHRFRDALVPVPDRDLRDARDLRDLLLRDGPVAQGGGDVDRRGGDAARRDARRELLPVHELQDVLRLPQDLHVEPEAVAEARDVVSRVLREQLQPDLADERAVRPPDALPVDRARLGDLVERPGNLALAARRVQGGGDDLVDAPPAHEALHARLAVQDRSGLAQDRKSTRLNSSHQLTS